MAVIWQKQTATTKFEVRNAGRALRLYTNGVLHTQYHPEKPITGYVWDLLLLAAFFYPSQSVKRVLVLGVGGGTVINTLRQFVQPQEIVGVELSKTHVQIAKRFFSISGKGVKLICEDAVEWIRNYEGEKFDLIIDDLFGETNGQPQQIMPLNISWVSLLRKHLTKNGMIVKNLVARTSLKQMRDLVQTSEGRRFKSIYSLSGRLDENRVGVFLRKKSSLMDLRENITKMPQLSAALKTGKLRYRVCQVK